MIYRSLLIILFIACSSSVVIANQLGGVIYRGVAPGAYSLPSLLLKTMQQPDVIELPLLLTKDNVPLVYPDIFLHSQTNVAKIFPGRNRQDGNYYLTDFTLAEIQQLSYASGSDILNVTSHPASFADALQAISAISSFLPKKPQIIPVIKYPWFHANEDKDISAIVIEMLISHSHSPETPLYLKCYDPDELQRIHKKLIPGLPVEIKLVQGIDRKAGQETMRKKRGTWYSYNYDWLFTRLGLRVLAGYATGISLKEAAITDEQTLTRLVTDSHGLKMKVYVELEDAQLSLPEKLFEYYFFTHGVDGLALSQPKLLRDFLAANQQLQEQQTDMGSSTLPPQGSDSILSDPEELSRRLQTLE